MQNLGAEQTRPHAGYRDLFYGRLLAQEPRSVLDLGCGAGALLRRLTAEGIEAVGLDPAGQGDAGDVQIVRAEAEALPFDDHSFDWTVCEFTAHHFRDVAAVLKEAGRVSRNGFALIDQWYDPTIPSQVTAERFDRWCKTVDQSTGMIHNPSLSTSECLELLCANLDPAPRIDIMTILTPRDIPADLVREAAGRALQPLRSPEPFLAALIAILDRAGVTGFTDDGAILAFVHFDR